MESLLNKNDEAVRLVLQIEAKMAVLKQHGIDIAVMEAERVALETENRDLREKIAASKTTLMETEIRVGDKQILIPEVKKVELAIKKVEAAVNKVIEAVNVVEENKIDQPIKIESANNEKSSKDTKPKAQKDAPKAKGDKKTDNVDSEVVDASKLDMRVGRILEVTRHQDADSLFIEKVDVGDGKPRQIISGLVKYCTEADLQGRLAVFLLNLKPAKMRGVLSEGMIMCASAPEQGKVEPLLVPDSCKPGDRVTVDGYTGVPDEVLNPKKKHFELIKPDLRVNEKGEATYKGAHWQVNGSVGVITATSLTDVQIS